MYPYTHHLEGSSSNLHNDANTTTFKHALETATRLHSRIHNLHSENAKLDGEACKWHRQATNAHDESHLLRNQLEEARTSLHQAEVAAITQRKASQDTVDKLTEQLEDLTAKHNQLSVQIELRDRRVIVLEGQLEDKRRYIRELETKVLESNHYLSTESESRDYRMESADVRSYEIAEVRKSFQESLQFLHQTQEERFVLLQQRQQLELRANVGPEAKTLKKRHDKELRVLTETHTSQASKLKSTILNLEQIKREKDDQIKELQQQAEAYAKDMESLKLQVHQLSQQQVKDSEFPVRETLVLRLEELQKDLNMHRLDSFKVLREQEEMQRECNLLRLNAVESRKKEESLQRTCSELEHELESLQEQYFQLTSEYEHLKQRDGEIKHTQLPNLAELQTSTNENERLRQRLRDEGDCEISATKLRNSLDRAQVECSVTTQLSQAEGQTNVSQNASTDEDEDKSPALVRNGVEARATQATENYIANMATSFEASLNRKNTAIAKLKEVVRKQHSQKQKLKADIAELVSSVCGVLRSAGVHLARDENIITSLMSKFNRSNRLKMHSPSSSVHQSTSSQPLLRHGKHDPTTTAEWPVVNTNELPAHTHISPERSIPGLMFKPGAIRTHVHTGNCPPPLSDISEDV